MEAISPLRQSLLGLSKLEKEEYRWVNESMSSKQPGQSGDSLVFGKTSIAEIFSHYQAAGKTKRDCTFPAGHMFPMYPSLEDLPRILENQLQSGGGS